MRFDFIEMVIYDNKNEFRKWSHTFSSNKHNQWVELHFALFKRFKFQIYSRFHDDEEQKQIGQ